ncbi:hypothetical protein SAMN05443575_1822 [Jatrophihabitans endophyticus]|uniref:Uncharacterized protein n=1 Tax=Jatrophihabitans endophyticus TaxID=1206085 RepID=A0A1M5IA21_9ACTN|nr:hypothetical protein SAMN05443575_1822 [Jatrophihabitans endophyticus]
METVFFVLLVLAFVAIAAAGVQVVRRQFADPR